MADAVAHVTGIEAVIGSPDEWRIYYADGSVVRGHTQEEWAAAPDSGVQVVVRMRTPDTVTWHCGNRAVTDRELWTGEDVLDPFGWGAKVGTLMDDEAYLAVWERACAD
jgi:hypothetical protein